jgi:hypothetical protein
MKKKITVLLTACNDSDGNSGGDAANSETGNGTTSTSAAGDNTTPSSD